MALTDEQIAFAKNLVDLGSSKASIAGKLNDEFGMLSNRQTKALTKLLSDLGVSDVDAPGAPTPEGATGTLQTKPGGPEKTKQKLAPFSHERASFKIKPVAPYRFVPLNAHICFPEDEVAQSAKHGTLHSLPHEESLSGELLLTVECDGPILVGGAGQSSDAPALLGNTPVLPGPTLKGVTRATLETAAFARLAQTNTHRRYGIRMFEHELFEQSGGKGGEPTPRAGWLRKTESGPVIIPCRWWPVRIRDFFGDEADPSKTGGLHGRWLVKKFEDRYTANVKGYPPGHKIRRGEIYDFRVSARFSETEKPGFHGVETDPVGLISGTYVFSDRLGTLTTNLDLVRTLNAQDAKSEAGNHKKTEAVFEAFDETAKALKVTTRVWDTFVANNSTFSRNKSVPAGNWAKLAKTYEADLPVPVFWEHSGEEEAPVLDLGLVRAFKRAHRYAVEDLIRRSSVDHLKSPDDTDWEPDFVEALFGYVYEPSGDKVSGGVAHAHRHLKSRVSFGFAKLSQDTPHSKKQATVVQAQPKPSFAPFYLANAPVEPAPTNPTHDDVRRKDWSDPNATLAGRKIYPAKGASWNRMQAWMQKTVEKTKGNKDVQSNLTFLSSSDGGKLVFDGAVRVHNVTPVELGAVIWALTLGGDPALRHMIGRAKASGAGQVRIRVTSMRVVSSDQTVAEITPDACRVRFEQFIAEWCEKAGLGDWASTPQITSLQKYTNPSWGAAREADLVYLDSEGKGLSGHQEVRRNSYIHVTNERILGDS